MCTVRSKCQIQHLDVVLLQDIRLRCAEPGGDDPELLFSIRTAHTALRDGYSQLRLGSGNTYISCYFKIVFYSLHFKHREIAVGWI